MKCINCKGEVFEQGIGDYSQFVRCTDCGMYKIGKQIAKSNVILPDDPMDNFACESCQ